MIATAMPSASATIGREHVGEDRMVQFPGLHA